jgi:hypothetical protein
MIAIFVAKNGRKFALNSDHVVKLIECSDDGVYTKVFHGPAFTDLDGDPLLFEVRVELPLEAVVEALSR